MKNESVTLEIGGAQLTATKKELFCAWFERHFNSEPLEFYTSLGNRMPKLNEGEIYLGAVTSLDGITTHTILLPSDLEDKSWQESMDWAKSIGCDLPDRVEQSMLFKYFKSEFKERAYWSNTPHADDVSYAWCQYFNGIQDTRDKNNKLRARAVRRLVI